MLARYPARRSLRWAIRLVVFALTMACVLRVQLGNSYTMLLSDSLDGLIQTSLMQHWYNVFRGLEPWNAPAYFYPNKDTLGYNDGFFLHGVIYSVFRWSGCDPFLSAELAGQAIRAVGFFAFEVFAATVLGFGFGWALLGAVVFTLSNNLYVQAAHGQLMTVSFAPLLGWLLWRGLQALKAPSLGWFDRGATLCGCAAALLYGAWLLTGFYMAWFATFFVVLVVLATAVQDAAGRGAGWRAWRMLWVRPVLPVGVVTLLAILPFLVVYLPKAQETGSHSFAEVMVYSPAPTDILHIGSGNLLFGAVDKAVTQALRPASDDYGEHTIGFPPLLALLATAGAVLAWARPRGPHPVLLRSLALATAVSFIALVHLGAHTLWYWVHAYFPGAKGVRVVARYAIFLAFPVTLLAVDFLR
jgi:hypothetical protein